MPRTYLGENVYVRYVEENLEFCTIIKCIVENRIELRPSMFSMLWGYVHSERPPLYAEKMALGGWVCADLDSEGDLTLTIERDGSVEASVSISPGVWCALMKYVDRESETVVHK